MFNYIRRYYNPVRVYAVFFRVLLTVFFLIIRQKNSFLFIRPLKPKELIKKRLTISVRVLLSWHKSLQHVQIFFTEDYLHYLRQMHDEIPPMTEKHFDIVYKRAFHDKVCFAEFDREPIASASIGQVHRAVLKDGREVAVKLRRYDIENIIRADINILNVFNRFFRPLFSENTKNSLDSVIREFSKMIIKEVDLSIELNNMRKFAETYHYAGVGFPEGHQECSSTDALVMSFVHGYRFDDKENLEKKLNISFEDIMEKLVLFFM